MERRKAFFVQVCDLVKTALEFAIESGNDDSAVNDLQQQIVQLSSDSQDTMQFNQDL